MTLVPPEWDVDKDRARFLLALRNVVPESYNWLLEMSRRLFQQGKGGDGRARWLLAVAWARRYRLFDAAQPERPAPWAVNAAYFNVTRWIEGLEESEELGDDDEDEDIAMLKALVGDKRRSPVDRCEPDFTFLVPWYDVEEDRLVAWEDPDPFAADIRLQIEVIPGDDLEEFLRRVTSQAKAMAAYLYERTEQHARSRSWQKPRQHRRPRQQERSSPDDPARHFDWLALRLGGGLSWRKIAELYTHPALPNPVEPDTVRMGATRLAKRIGVALPRQRP
mgnify:CR=1 FL=1